MRLLIISIESYKLYLNNFTMKDKNIKEIMLELKSCH